MTSPSESTAGPAFEATPRDEEGRADRPAPPEAAVFDDPDDLVVLLDGRGRRIGTTPRPAVHTGSTPLHLAFSCHIFDVGGRVLITRRGLGKITWPGVWTNSCCGHPRPGEPMKEAIVRRVREELGLDLNPEAMGCVIPDFCYRATDASGIVENELCPVYLALLDDPEEIVELYPDPDEVEDVAWVGWKDLYRTVQTMSPLLSPWSVLQIRQLGEDIASRLP